MDLKETKYLLTIAKHKNITYAAKELFITQPSLSKYLQNIENQLGSPLFSRIGHTLVPTYLGERYLHYAQQIVNLGTEWENEYADTLNLNKGTLTVAFPLMRSTCIIPAVLPAFHAKYPDITIAIQEEAHSIEKRLTLTNEIDLAIYNPPSLPSELDYQTIGTEEIVMILPPNHPLAAKADLREDCRYPWLNLNLFHQEPFILHHPEQNTGKIAQALFAQAGFAPQVLLQTRNTEVAIRLSASGLGISFAPESYLKHMQFHGQLPPCFSVGFPKTEITLYAACKKGRYLPQYTQDFIHMVQAYFQNMIHQRVKTD